jgi:hypothetical protein
MKIISIEKSENTKSHSENSFFFKITVEFEAPAEDPYFGMLGKYFKAVVLLDREKYEQHYAHFDTDDVSFVDTEDGEFKQMVFKKPSPYVLGYCKTLDCVGSDCLVPLGDNKFKYSQYISSNFITEAAVKQLEEMKQHIDNNYCRYGDFPTQVGAFRSGDPFSDFIGILETLDRFWD